MARKDFTFKGQTIEQLQSMELGDFAKLCKADRRRRINRGLDKNFLKKIEKAFALKKEGKEPKIIRTHLRDAIVIPRMIGLKFAIYNGHEFLVIEVNEKMLGHYLGEFVLTRKRIVHGKAGIGATKSSTAITARG